MARNPTAVLKKAIRSVAEGVETLVTDRELLRRYVADKDQAAFATLVGRHTGMVLGVCRRALPTVQDAEDACQATFLLLSRKADGVRWQSSIASWLYVTARGVARNARVAAQRRARREAKAAVPEVVEAVDRMTGRELLAMLDEALARLSPLYREPLVLCFLEGLTRDEAAARLGVPPATLQTRIDRARKKLHDALTKGGCVLGAGLLALAVTSPAGASPPRLVQSILGAASGSPSAAVAELMKGVVVNGTGKTVGLVLIAVLGVGALGLGLGSQLSPAVGQPSDKPATPDTRPFKDAQPGREKIKVITVTGRVHDPDGKELAGAKLSLVGSNEDATELGTSGPDGQFKVEVPADKLPAHLVARADGFGMQFVSLAPLDPSGDVELRTVEVRLRLVKDEVIRGRVIDLQGKPVAGAKVTVARVGAFANSSLEGFVAGWQSARRSRSPYPGEVKALTRDAGLLPVVTTDAEGRFTVAGTGAERLVTLRLRAAGIAEAELWVVNRDGFDPRPYNQPPPLGGGLVTIYGIGRSPTWWPTLVYGPELGFVAEAEQPIRGVVKDADTGKARPGVTVWLSADHGSLSRPLSATTDAEGRYEIRGARKAKSYVVWVAKDPASGHLPAQVEVNDTPWFEPVIADLKVKKAPDAPPK